MRSVFLESSDDESLLSQARTRMREEEFITTAKAFLSLLVVAEGDYLYYVQSKLLPHKLSFDHHLTPSTPARDASHPTQCESRPVIVEAQTHTSPFATSTLQLDTYDNTLGIRYMPLRD